MLNSMQWLNPPAEWRVQEDRLIVRASAHTDFWRKTHYGFICDSGHFFYQEVTGPFVATVRTCGHYASLYDQCGLMVRTSEMIWMKCGIEFVDKVQQASVVVTNDYSDWSVTPLQQNPPHTWFRVRRKGTDIEVFYSFDGTAFQLLRVAHLPTPDKVQMGMMCAVPKGRGFDVEFDMFSLASL